MFSRHSRHREDAEEALKTLPRTVNRMEVRKALAGAARVENSLIRLAVDAATEGRAFKREVAAAAKALKTVARRYDPATPPCVTETLELLEGSLERHGRRGWILWHYNKAMDELRTAGVSKDLARSMLRAVVKVPGPAKGYSAEGTSE
jgi:hypothetical protein